MEALKCVEIILLELDMRLYLGIVFFLMSWSFNLLASLVCVSDIYMFSNLFWSLVLKVTGTFWRACNAFIWFIYH